jgi:hypothetical protein
MVQKLGEPISREKNWRTTTSCGEEGEESILVQAGLGKNKLDLSKISRTKRAPQRRCSRGRAPSLQT